MTKRNGVSKKIGLLLLAGTLTLNCAYSQESEQEGRDQQRTRQAQAVSKPVYDKIQKAQEFTDAQDYWAAMEVLRILKNSTRITDYERANVLNYIAIIHYYMEDLSAAIAAYEEMLGIPDQEPQLRKRTMYQLAQLLMAEERFEDGLAYLEDWFGLEPNPAPGAYNLLAQCYYQLNRYKDMILPIETAIEVAIARELAIKEDWYVLLNFAYFQQEEYVRVRDIQKILLATWPKKQYWFYLAGAYTELGDEQNLLATYDAAHTNGLLNSESEFVTMAQLYLQNEIPYKAATLLEAEIESGRVARAEKNYRLLSQAWTLAQEDEKAIPALKEAATLSGDGEIDLRLGNAHLNLGRYAECAASVREGLNKGGIKSPDNAYISLGMCLYNLHRYDEAIDAFDEAKKTPRSAKLAEQWKTVIGFDLKRNEQIQLAETNARKKQQELLERREASDRS